MKISESQARVLNQMRENAVRLGRPHEAVIDEVSGADSGTKVNVEEGFGHIAFAVEKVLDFVDSDRDTLLITPPDIQVVKRSGPDGQSVFLDEPYTHGLVFPRFRDVETLVTGRDDALFETVDLYMERARTNLGGGLTVVRFTTGIPAPARRRLHIARGNAAP